MLSGSPSIPFIFIEWQHVARNDLGNCPHFHQWVHMFYTAGYKPYNSGDVLQITLNFNRNDILVCTATMTEVRDSERDQYDDLVWVKEALVHEFI